MIGLDTNVIVRFLAQDDEVQSPFASRLFSRLSRDNPGFVSLVVLAEVSWVLARAYKSSKAELSTAIEGLLRSAELKVENAEAAWRALGVYQASKSAEFADALIAEIAAIEGVTRIFTFDRRAATDAGMLLLA